MTKLYYGVGSFTHMVDCVEKAVSVFGGDEEHERLLLGTACTETDLATFGDVHPDKWGVSVVQFDQIRFDDVITRTRKKHRELFFKHYKIRLGSLKLHAISRNPEVAFALCRLAYILIPEAVPKNIRGQAEYWKTHWNTHHANAKGTPESYMADWANFMPRWI